MKNNFTHTENSVEVDISKTQSKQKEYSSYGSPDIDKHYFDSKEKAMADAKKMGLIGIHSYKKEDGKVVYMAGPDHASFMKKHKSDAEKKDPKKSYANILDNIANKKD